MNDQGMEWWQTVGIHEAHVKEEYESWCDERRQEAIEHQNRNQYFVEALNEVLTDEEAPF